jgi:hypothetical protein
MELKGEVLQVLDPVTGEGKNGQWEKQIVIVELATDSKYPKMVALTLWGDLVGACSPHDMITAQVDIESRDYNGRWYTDVKAWKVEIAPETTSQETVQPDLPF